MKNFSVFLSGLLLLIVSTISAFAQDLVNAAPEPAVPMMHENGKLFVVVAVVLVIFVGIVAYLIRLEKKLSDIEKRVKNDKK